MEGIHEREKGRERYEIHEEPVLFVDKTYTRVSPPGMQARSGRFSEWQITWR